jgi:plastocyanin
MKYVYIVLVLALIGGGYFLFVEQQKAKVDMMQVPEGYHRMEDGSLMKTGDARMEEGVGTVTPQEPKEVPKASVTLDPYAKVFAVKGVNYGFDVKEIKVKQGDTVTINFMSSDGFHDWKIDEFAAATQKVQPGTPTSVTFVADKKGEFEYYCSVGQHRAHGMVGKLIVE